jgi:gliding motility associated protien GldN
MKRILLTIAVALATSFQLVVAQYVNRFDDSSRPFFDSKGAVRLETVELDEAADTLVNLRQRTDDIVWSRVVYRVIDMRYKQNYQLYFPILPNDAYLSMFRLMLQSIVDTYNEADVPGKQRRHNAYFYGVNPDDIRPVFSDSMKLSGRELSKIFKPDNGDDEDECFNSLIQYDTINGTYSIKEFSYMQYVRNQIKFLIQEVYFFDKHTSRLHSKILGIAPLYALRPDFLTLMESYAANNQPMDFFMQSILGWFSFDELRPELARHYMIPKNNDSHRMTFDEFFGKKLYSSYLLGDSNMFNRMLLKYVTNMDDVVKEQQRIERELLDFEQDLWEN